MIDEFLMLDTILFNLFEKKRRMGLVGLSQITDCAHEVLQIPGFSELNVIELAFSLYFEQSQHCIFHAFDVSCELEVEYLFVCVKIYEVQTVYLA